MSQRHIPASLRRKVAEQAEYRCGYCQTAQAYSGVQLHVEHIIPLAAGGRTIESNLWLACALCNSYKGARTHGIDPTTSQSIPLYNPRVQNWFDHFTWSADGLSIIGTTPCGRATVATLQLNNEYILIARKNWVRVGWHPPSQ
ncbi:MAG: HNH endonuclease [Calditrichaceae bacterium]|nr:HNH endonuclease [Calditrichia bacterium]NUQ43395.1 HNH endonuclease [Calditrichaceae bacterium]